MHPFHDWLDRVLTAGESVQNAPPQLTPVERSAVEARLHAAFDLHRLDVAGPTIAFDPDVALRAATVLAQACWQLVGGDAYEPMVLEAVATPSATLSADVTLRFLPAVYRRGRSHEPGHPLVAELDRLLRAWPLSGVLADLAGAPNSAIDFDGHPGLQLLYAERLVANGRAGWVPPDGPARARAECVFAERGTPLPAELPKEEARA
jgi:hypothetical protein